MTMLIVQLSREISREIFALVLDVDDLLQRSHPIMDFTRLLRILLLFSSIFLIVTNLDSLDLSPDLNTILGISLDRDQSPITVRQRERSLLVDDD